jgi:hypothetical protein
LPQRNIDQREAVDGNGRADSDDEVGINVGAKSDAFLAENGEEIEAVDDILRLVDGSADV